MTRAISVIGLVLLGVAAAGPGQDKGPFPRDPGSGSELRLLESRDVLAELKLSKDQAKKVDELTRKARETFSKTLQELKGKEAYDKLQELMAANRKALADILSEKQYARLKQLDVQQRGPFAFVSPPIAKELGLRADQVAKIREIIRQAGKKFAQLSRANLKPEELQKKLAKLQNSITDDMVKTLSEEQQQKWRTLVGERFKGRLPPAVGGPESGPAGQAGQAGQAGDGVDLRGAAEYDAMGSS